MRKKRSSLFFSGSLCSALFWALEQNFLLPTKVWSLLHGVRATLWKTLITLYVGNAFWIKTLQNCFKILKKLLQNPTKLLQNPTKLLQNPTKLLQILWNCFKILQNQIKLLPNLAKSNQIAPKSWQITSKSCAYCTIKVTYRSVFSVPDEPSTCQNN